MHTSANIEDPDEMLHKAAFHHGLHCLPRRQKWSSEQEIHFHLEIITCDPLIFTIVYPKSVVSNQKEEAICAKRVKM